MKVLFQGTVVGRVDEKSLKVSRASTRFDALWKSLLDNGFRARGGSELDGQRLETDTHLQLSPETLGAAAMHLEELGYEVQW